MEFVLIGVYWWICFLFGFWYLEKRMQPSKLQRATERESAWITVTLCSIFTMWFYWPLALVYLYEEKKERLNNEIENMRRQAGTK